MNVLYNILDFILPFEWISPTFMKNAFLAILVACPLFGILGCSVVTNKMSFFSDAIGHSALTGIALGLLIGIRDVTFSMIIFSLILGAAIICVKIKGKASSDTVIGVFSSTSVALGLVLLSANGSISKYNRYLIGDILSIQTYEIALLAVSLILLIVIWVIFYNKMLLTSLHPTFAKSRGIKTFGIELLFALVTAAIVSVSISWTGLLVINSMLVLPAASSRMISNNSRQYLLWSVAISFVSGIVGLILSYYFGSASGATIVLVNAVLFTVCFITSVCKRK